MIAPATWLIKLLLAHLITDFILQPRSWVDQRNQKHFASAKLYLHGLITGLVAWMMIGWQHWLVALIICLSHTLIDGWKSYRKSSVSYFLIDQALHLAIILGCWLVTFQQGPNLAAQLKALNQNLAWWKVATAFVFLTAPAGILIGQLTSQWRDKIENAESLANAGKWIGMIERTVILIFVLYNQFSAIGLLIAAKGIIRFNEKDRPEIKTEYLVIGTLMSLVTALITGLAVKI